MMRSPTVLQSLVWKLRLARSQTGRKIGACLMAAIAIGLLFPLNKGLLWAQNAMAASAASNSLTGWFMVQRGDAPPGASGATTVYTLMTEEGDSIVLVIDQALGGSYAGLSALDRRKVMVQGEWSDGFSAFAVASIQPLVQAMGLDNESAAREAIQGPQPWVSILCKFRDSSAEPKSVGYFDSLFSDDSPGLGDYWREQSYDRINILGSDTVGWYTLPESRSAYLDGDNVDWGKAFGDCTAMADEEVYFPGYMGINLMFNETIGCCAWGGGSWSNLDGVEKIYYTTWMPPWGYENQTLMAHEMGHGFGLPHSSGQYGETYDNAWDVMSNSWYGCDVAHDPIIGCLGQHTISFHKDKLGWIPASEHYFADIGTHTVTLERLALPTTGNYKMVQIPIGGSNTHFYSVEVRDRVGYDSKLPGKAVIIHEVDTARPNQAQVIDIDHDRDTSDGGAMWLPGEAFSDHENNISVHIVSETDTGYVVSIVNGSFPTPTPIPTDTPTPTLTPTVTPTPIPILLSLESDPNTLCDSFIANTCRIDFSGREYSTVRSGLKGNKQASPVEFGSRRLVPDDFPWSHRWEFYENGELIDKGARVLASEAGSYWSWSIRGQPGAQSVTIYFFINHNSRTPAGEYEISVAGDRLNLAKSEAGNSWYALNITFSGDITVRMESKGDYQYGSFALAAGVVETQSPPIPTPTPTMVHTITPTATPTIAPTATASVTPTATSTPEATPTATSTRELTSTPTIEATDTPGPTDTPPPEIPPGDYSLSASVYLDYRCDGLYKAGMDTHLAGVPVEMVFANGAERQLTTSSGGMAYFYGFDPSDGVAVEADLPEEYRGNAIGLCSNSRGQVELEVRDFRWKRKSVYFRVEYQY